MDLNHLMNVKMLILIEKFYYNFSLVEFLEEQT